MSAFTMAGSVTSALSHFALCGLAAIGESELGAGARLWWTDEPNPRPQLDVGHHPPLAIAEAVHRHAVERTSGESWLDVRIYHEGSQTAAFSPRIKAPSSRSAWEQLQGARHAVLDRLADSGASIDLRMIGGLGEPAYWLSDKTPDGGASRWEMKTRNRGEEFVGNRLAPLARCIAARRVEDVLSGLIGATVTDEAGANKPESRSATGFARPGPVDNARAWCALWGISQFPVVHHADGQSVTAATNVPGKRTHPTFVFLPVATQPITLARYRTIIASKHLAVAGTFASDTGSVDRVSWDASQKWLAGRNIRALIQFPVCVSDNPSAPERQVLNGSPVPVVGRA
jgi:CRISPR-associated protein Csb3